MKLEIEQYETDPDELELGHEDWRWHVTADNGQIIAAASEGFDSRYNAERNYELFLANAAGVWMAYNQEKRD